MHAGGQGVLDVEYTPLDVSVGRMALVTCPTCCCGYGRPVCSLCSQHQHEEMFLLAFVSSNQVDMGAW